MSIGGIVLSILAWLILAGFFWCLCAAAADDSPIVPGSLSRRDYPDADSWCGEPEAETEPRRPVPARELPAPAAAQTRSLRLL